MDIGKAVCCLGRVHACVLLLISIRIGYSGAPFSEAACEGPAAARSYPITLEANAWDSELRFTGEVSRGEEFQKLIAPNLVFRLLPYAGNDSGWAVRLTPGVDTKAMPMDCIGSVSEPLHGNRNLSIDLSDNASQDDAQWRRHEFNFVPNVASCVAAWDLAKLAYDFSKPTDEQRSGALESLSKIPTGHGKLQIADFRLSPSRSANAPAAIEWLKFEVQLTFPAPPLQKLSPGKEDRSQLAPHGSIHEADVQKFLKAHYLDVQPDLEWLKEECSDDRDPITYVNVQYGDLDSDGQDEAVYQGLTCMAGTAGTDFFGVLKIMPDGKFVALPIEEEGEMFKSHPKLHEGIRGKLGLKIKNGRLLKVFPIYRGDEANCCPEGGERDFIYRWDGRQFVLDDTADIPPEKQES